MNQLCGIGASARRRTLQHTEHRRVRRDLGELYKRVLQARKKLKKRSYAKKYLNEVSPGLKHLYNDQTGHHLASFYLEDMQATLYAMGRKWKLHMDEAGKLPAAIESHIITPILYKMVSKGIVSGWMKKRIEKRKKEDPEMGRQMEHFIRLFTQSPLKGHLKKESIYNQFYWDLVTPIKHGIDVPGTVIHVFYALGMGKKYEKRYLTYFAHPDIRRQNLNHETYLFCYPDKWAGEVEDCCGMK